MVESLVLTRGRWHAVGSFPSCDCAQRDRATSEMHLPRHSGLSMCGNYCDSIANMYLLQNAPNCTSLRRLTNMPIIAK